MQWTRCLSMGLGAFLAVIAPAEAVEWRTGFQDDFERAELGEQYQVVAGKAAIAGGRLRIDGDDAQVLLNLPLSRDVQVEFEAMPLPDGRAGYLGCLLHASSGKHYRFEVEAEAGGKVVDRISGAGLELIREKTGPRAGPGQWRHILARREGKQFTLRIDGEVVLEGGIEKVVGAAGIQRIGLLAGHGMLVDNLRVSNRVPSHPDCCPPPLPWLPLTRQGRRVVATEGVAAPGLDEALEALNAGRFEEAKTRFEAMDDVTLRLTGLAYILGDLNYYERPVYGYLNAEDRDKRTFSEEEISTYYGEFGLLAARWEAAAGRYPDQPLLRTYLPYMRNVGRMVLQRWHTFKYAQPVADLDERVSPFHHKARLYLARSTYWNGMEGANNKLKVEALNEMRNLLALWPDNRILREYAGEPVVWGEELNADTENHPAWAAYLREAYTRGIAVLERSCELRQTPDGQLGGGWGDDVELLRRWAPVAAISTCSEKVVTGIERLCDGVWMHVLKDGYDKGFGDVEHSAEPSADSVPIMLLLRYGDPLWVERNLRSCKTIRDLFMGIDEKGFPRFKAAHFGVREVATGAGAGGDTGYHARVMKHFLWAAWQGDAEAADWYLRWVDGWRAMCMLDAPDKPAGVLPGTIFYPSGSYQPPNQNPWYYDGPVHTYGAGGLPAMIHDCFLAAYALSGDQKFLQPVQKMMDWATLGPLMPDGVHNTLPAGSPEWFRLPLAHTARATHTALYRMLTGERVYDEYTMRFGTAPQLYQIDHDLNRYMKDIEAAAQSLRTNLWFRSTEVQSTDRLGLPAVEALFGAYTGAILLTGDTDYQTFAVTYDTPSTDFAALVVDTTPKRLRVWLYSFWDQPTTIHLRPWRLTPGEYILTAGRRLKGEFPFQNRYGWGKPQRVRITHRAQPVPITLPPGVEYVVDLRLDEETAAPSKACDLAVHPRDVAVQGKQLSLTIHNIGNAPAEGFTVALQRKSGDEWETVATRQIARLAHPANLIPCIARVTMEVTGFDLADQYRFVLDPESTLYELCETNNIAEIRPHRVGPLAAPPDGVDPQIAELPPTLSLRLNGDLAIELVLVPPGEFSRDTPADAEKTKTDTPRRVRLDRPFYISKEPITQIQWKIVINNRDFEGDGALPAEGITRKLAERFCDRLSKRIWKSIRLPTEPEWEHARRTVGSAAGWSQTQPGGEWTANRVTRQSPEPDATRRLRIVTDPPGWQPDAP